MDNLLAQIVQTECLTRGKRQRIRGDVAAALKDHVDLESRALRAELSLLVEPKPESAQALLAIAEEALTSGAQQIAKRIVSTCEQATSDDRFAAEIASIRSRLGE